MKRISVILFLMFISFCGFSQNLPHKMDISRFRTVEGLSKEDIYKRMEEWGDDIASMSRFNFGSYDDFSNKIVRFTYVDRNAPNFGYPEILGGGPAEISFHVTIYCKANAYIAKIEDILVLANPSLGYLYGEGGVLYPECYSKRQLKNSGPVIDYLYSLSDEIFNSIEESIIPD